MATVKKCANCKRRKRLKDRTKCGTCANKAWREKDPVKTSYVNLKHNAKRRGKVFTITLAYFRRFCYRTDYIAGKGRTADSWTVDRIKEWLGYVPGNLQKLKNGDNTRKYLEYCWQTKEAKVISVGRKSDDFLF